MRNCKPLFSKSKPWSSSKACTSGLTGLTSPGGNVSWIWYSRPCSTSASFEVPLEVAAACAAVRSVQERCARAGFAAARSGKTVRWRVTFMVCICPAEAFAAVTKAGQCDPSQSLASFRPTMAGQHFTKSAEPQTARQAQLMVNSGTALVPCA